MEFLAISEKSVGGGGLIVEETPHSIEYVLIFPRIEAYQRTKHF